MPTLYALGTKLNDSFQLTSDWKPADGGYEAGAKLFAHQAKNGQTLHVKFDWGSNWMVGLFYGRNRFKSLVRHDELIRRGDYKRWVFSACDLIGDQSSVEDLTVASLKQGCQFNIVSKGLILPFEHFEHHVRAYMKSLDQQSVLYRTQWRKKHKIERDCRTYAGQPGRNMRRAA